MPTRTFRINGTVIDNQTQKPVEGVRVDALSTVGDQQVVLGSGTTDAKGRFQIVAEAEVPATPVGGSTGVVPATLAVFQGQQPLRATGDTEIPNLFTFDRQAALQVQMPVAPPPPVEPQGTDRITVSHVMTAVNFVHQSDFAGVFREGRDRTSAVGKVLLDSLKSAVKSVNLKPLKPSDVRNHDVLNQDPQTARNRLSDRNIQVSNVLPYQPGVGNLGTITSIAGTIKPGDSVDLYEENGVVKAYKIRKAVTPATDTNQLSGEVTNLQNDVRNLQQRNQEIDQVKATQESNATTLAALQQKAAAVDQLETELVQVREQSAQKDQVIAQLQNDVANVRTAHDALAAKISPERLAALEETVRRIQINR